MEILGSMRMLHIKFTSETNSSSASQEIPRIFGTRRFLTILTSARHLSNYQQLLNNIPKGEDLKYTTVKPEISYISLLLFCVALFLP